MNVSKLFGKKTESTSGKKGYVISVNGGNGKVECLVCADEDENEFIVDMKDVVMFGEKIIYQDRTDAFKNARPLLIGRSCFDDRGNYLGEVEDYAFKGNKLLSAKIGKKNYPADELICGDVVIISKKKRLSDDVLKDGKIIFKKGDEVTEELLLKAEQQGEYIQTSLKSL